MAAKSQLFQFDGRLCEQADGVAMGSPLGPLVALVSMFIFVIKSLDA